MDGSHSPVEQCDREAGVRCVIEEKKGRAHEPLSLSSCFTRAQSPREVSCWHSSRVDAIQRAHGVDQGDPAAGNQLRPHLVRDGFRELVGEMWSEKSLPLGW